MIFTMNQKRSLYLVLFGLALHFSAYATGDINGTWQLDKSIPPYCDRHPDPYTAAELKAIEKMQSRLPDNFKITIETPTAAANQLHSKRRVGRDIVGDANTATVRLLNIKEVSPEQFLVFLAGVPEEALPRIYELRPSILGAGYLELLNIDVETCGLNNAVATLKLVK